MKGQKQKKFHSARKIPSSFREKWNALYVSPDETLQGSYISEMPLVFLGTGSIDTFPSIGGIEHLALVTAHLYRHPRKTSRIGF